MGSLLLAAGQAPAPSAPLPSDFRGQITYQGEWTGETVAPVRSSRRATLGSLLNQLKGEREQVGGTVSYRVSYDGTELSGVASGTGMRRGRFTGTRNGSRCTLRSDTGDTGTALCDRASFNPQWRSPGIGIGRRSSSQAITSAVGGVSPVANAAAPVRTAMGRPPEPIQAGAPEPAPLTIAAAGPAAARTALEGSWEIVATCRGRSTQVRLSLFKGYRGDLQGNVRYFAWNDDQISDLWESWDVRGDFAPDGRSITLTPIYLANHKSAMARGEVYRWYPVTFVARNGRWAGQLQDPSCNELAFTPPRAERAVSTGGRALSDHAWAGHPPTFRIGSQTLFDYIGLRDGTLNAAESRAGARWGTVEWARYPASPGSIVSYNEVVMRLCGDAACSFARSRLFFAELSSRTLRFASRSRAGRSCARCSGRAGTAIASPAPSRRAPPPRWRCGRRGRWQPSRRRGCGTTRPAAARPIAATGLIQAVVTARTPRSATSATQPRSNISSATVRHDCSGTGCAAGGAAPSRPLPAKELTMLHARLPIALACLAAVAAATPQPSREIAAAVASPARTPANTLRDRYRHSAETLAFFGVRPGQTVVEFLPSTGWYTEILAPLVKGRGRYVALVPPAQAERTRAMLAARAAQFGPAEVGTLDAAAGTSTVAPGSADVVLTFRNVHNLLMNADPAVPGRAFAAFYAALKPGGVLGVEDHRLPEEMDVAREKTTGYVKRSTVIRLATQAGFRLAGESAVNANPRDDHDHPEGVWTLPPTYRLKEVDRAKWAAIGESDRLTLKFVKPR